MKAILTYHSIDERGSPVSVPPTVFEEHVRWFLAGRVRVVSLDDLLSTDDTGDDSVAITFDDGLSSARGAMLRLLEHGVPATVFVVSGHVGGTNDWGRKSQPGIPTLPLMTWDDLGRFRDQGGTIQAHTRTHPRLSELPAEELDDELLGCAEDLRRHLGVTASQLAYPYGDANLTVMRRTAAFYRRACTTELRLMRAHEDPIRLPRLDLYYFRRSGTLESWGSRLFARRLAWCRARRSLRQLVNLNVPGRG